MLKSKNYLAWMLVFVLFLFTASCGGGESGSTTPTTITVTPIDIPNNNNGNGGNNPNTMMPGPDPNDNDNGGNSNLQFHPVNSYTIGQKYLDESNGVVQTIHSQTLSDPDITLFYVSHAIVSDENFNFEFLGDGTIRTISTGRSYDRMLEFAVEYDLDYRSRTLTGDVGSEYSDKDNPSIQAWWIFGDSIDGPTAADQDIVVNGLAVESIPLGEFTYNGNSIETVLGVERDNFSFTYHGTFEMTVDFSNESGLINLSSLSDRYSSSLSGEFNIDLDMATFKGTELEYSADHIPTGKPSSAADLVSDYNGTATIYGSFHSLNATGVSGIFHGNSENKYVGGFIGYRADLR